MRKNFESTDIYIKKKRHTLFTRVPIFFCISIAFAASVGRSETDSSLSFGKRIINGIDKKHTEWVESYTDQFEEEICGRKFPDLTADGLATIRKKAERITNKCYAREELPPSIGIDYSTAQSEAEEIFFDSLVRTKLDHLTCRESAIDCLNKNTANEEIATDFVDRLNAFRIYREKYRAFNVEEKKKVTFTSEEKKILSKYFPGSTTNSAEFFKDYQPVTAMALLVNFMDPANDRSFLFQEAFASLAEDDDSLKEFSKMNRKTQIKAISDYIKTSSEGQKKAIQDERAYWERHCKSKDPNCFFRPIFEQKRKLIDEFILNTSYDPSLWSAPSNNNTVIKKPSKEEMAFACSLQLKYGKGATYYDNQMNNVVIALAAIPIVSRPIAGALASRNLTARVMGEKIARNRFYQHTIKAAGAGLNGSGKLALGSQIINIYEACESGEFKIKPKLPFAAAKTPAARKTREEFLADCKQCKRQPSAKKVVNYSCIKDASNWLISKSMGIAKPLTKISTLDKAANDSNETAIIPEKIDQVSEALSIFLKNQALITTFDVPSISDFTDDTGHDNKL